MNKEIWKFQFDKDTRLQQFQMPDGAEVLSAQLQNNNLCIWAIVDPTARKVARQFIFNGTGCSIPDGPRRFIATVQNGPWVWHVFECLEI